MSFVNFRKKEISFKIVYYGPARSGKTTNLESIHAIMADDVKGDMTMLSTQEDRSGFFRSWRLSSLLKISVTQRPPRRRTKATEPQPKGGSAGAR